MKRLLIVQKHNDNFVLEDETAKIYSKFFYLKENIREKLFDEINRVINN